MLDVNIFAFLIIFKVNAAETASDYKQQLVFRLYAV